MAWFSADDSTIRYVLPFVDDVMFWYNRASGTESKTMFYFVEFAR